MVGYLEIPNTESRINEFIEKEREVDKQIIKWNFEAELRHTKLNYMYGNTSIQNETSVDAIWLMVN